jgi:hypothetical protein
MRDKLFVFGDDDKPMEIQWSAESDFTDWSIQKDTGSMSLDILKNGTPVTGWRKYLFASVGAFAVLFVLLWMSLPVWGPLLAILVYALGN